MSTDLTWRIMLALGAVPALATFSLRRQITETPRFALSQGNFTEVARAIAQATQQAQQNASSTDKVQARPTPPKNAELQIPRDITQWLAGWAERDGYTHNPIIFPQQSGIIGEQWDSCQDHANIIHYRIYGGKHNWPQTGFMPNTDGRPTHATSLIWQFFWTHQLS